MVVDELLHVRRPSFGFSAVASPTGRICEMITGRYSTELAKMIEITPAPLTLSGM